MANNKRTVGETLEYPAIILEISTNDNDSDTYRIKDGELVCKEEG